MQGVFDVVDDEIKPRKRDISDVSLNRDGEVVIKVEYVVER
jgi:hypothetical protein